MYQFYYAEILNNQQKATYSKNITEYFNITAVRPTMWEEHCLECSAPLCFEDCLNYSARVDGRCKRFDNGILVTENELGCCGQASRVKFRKWANMMTIIFPEMMPIGEYKKMTDKNQSLGNMLKKIAYSKLPMAARWQSIRLIEYARRMKLRKLSGSNNPDAFVFHGFSFEKESFNLIVEIFDSHTSKFKLSLHIENGENLFVIDKSKLDESCWTDNFLVKIYPENNIEAELDILWCDFVKGTSVVKDKPADKVKCVVWDLDNTLWNGILIETDNPKELKLNSNVIETIKALDERGIIQSIASKNEFDQAWEVVKNFKLDEYFLYPQIHWNAKSLSLEQIAKDLNIGIDSLCLIDDSPNERKQVESVLSQVRTYDAIEIPELLTKPEFDAIITDESKMRRSMYRAEEKRNKLKNTSFADNESFLKQCNIVLDVFEPNADEEKLRCFELLLRTNQLNMSGIKYTKDEFESVINRENCHNLALSCKDDYGTYGIVGFVQYKVVDGILEFTEYAMSCRVAGKYVESALFAFLLERTSCVKGRFNVNKTKKNSLLRKTLEEIGFVILSESDKDIKYEVHSDLKNKDIVAVKGEIK